MKVTVLGCGNAFSTKLFNQQFLLEDGNSKMLIDCGQTTPFALLEAGISAQDITHIYISHQHADHVCGLENIAFQRYDWVNRPQDEEQWRLLLSTGKIKKLPPTLICNDLLMKGLWEHSLRGGLESFEGFLANIDTVFMPKPIKPNHSFEWEGWTCILIQQIHVMTGSSIMNTFGLFMEKEGHQSIYFTTDSQHCSPLQVENWYRKADVIFQDCECTGVDTSKIDRESGMLVENAYQFGSRVHANYAQLAGYPSANSIKLSDEIKGKMWLSHYQDFVIEGKDFFGNDCDWYALAKEDGFSGFAAKGQVFEF